MTRTMGSDAKQEYFNTNYELRDKQNHFLGWYRYDDSGHMRIQPAPGLSIHNAVSASLNLSHDKGYDVVLVFNRVPVNIPYAKTITSNIGNGRDTVIRDIIALYLQNVNTTQRG